MVYLGTYLSNRVDDLGLDAEWAQNLHDNLPNAVYGLLLIIVMLALPGGIVGVFRRLAALVSRIFSRPTHP